MSKIEENKDLIHRINAAKNANDVEKLKQYLAPDFIAHVCGYSKPLNREDYIKAVQLSHKAFSPFVITIDEVIAEGDRVAIRLTATGKHTGEYHGFEPSNHPVNFVGMMMKRIANGKLVEEWQVTDELTLFRQMGLSINHII